MGVALVRPAIAVTLLAGAALATTGAAPAEEQEMLRQFDRVLTAMAYAASGICVFAIVWAGFILMAEGGEERGSGRAKAAVVMAVVGRRHGGGGPRPGPVGQGRGRAAKQRPCGLPNPIEKRKTPC